ncbi:hypothetical protein THRCLA_06217 [Thraustotheca clavata]|uniref:Uracil-DNA glycosylase-like domain-containing protein n=1 Tax=Thraustotheca clavata TaxID=74557 RepID=A0A1V9ZQ36_9STRA|nr:hypothetical protein THRCLA_06217 [Thraustotheca clavata]
MFNRFRFGADLEQSKTEEDKEMPVAEPQAKRKPAEDAADRAAKHTKLTRKWQERYHSICDECFEKVIPCTHYADVPLRLLIVGHNPSENAWTSGFSYSNPSNRMWKLLMGDFHGRQWSGILPQDWSMTEQNVMPHGLGIGFSDLGHEAGNDAAAYGKAIMHRWKSEFYQRLQAHLERLRNSLHSNKEQNCDNIYGHGPLLVAFTGKRQYSFLFDPPLKRVDSGLQTSQSLPPDWPLPAACEVWVLPSSSGRAAMTDAARCKPYMDLAARLHEIPWPNAPNCTCSASTEAIKQEEM